MAFQNKNLSVLSYANNFTLWYYRTDDSIQDLMDGYFNTVSNILHEHDCLIINAGNGDYVMFVKSIENKNVKIGKEGVPNE